MSAAYIRRHYSVPAKRGARVEFDGQLGVITSCPGAYVRVRLDGQAHSVPVHPTWRMKYLTDAVESADQAAGDALAT